MLRTESCKQTLVTNYEVHLSYNVFLSTLTFCGNTINRQTKSYNFHGWRNETIGKKKEKINIVIKMGNGKDRILLPNRKKEES